MPKCTAKDFAALESKVKSGELSKRANPIVRELLATNKYKHLQPELDPFYQVSELVALYFTPEAQQTERRESAEKSLIDDGNQKAKIPAYLKAMARLSPGCFGGLNIEVIKRVRSSHF
jgi:hypothetical protein